MQEFLQGVGIAGFRTLEPDKSMRLIRTCVMLLGAVVFSVAARAEVEPGDFAFGMRLQVDTNKPVNVLRIPEQVYHGLVREDLGDLRVFDANGRPLPHSLRAQRLAERKTAQVWKSVDFTNAPTAQLDQGAYPERQYVLDLGESSRIEKLRIRWSDSVGTAIGTVRIDSSHDLQNWTSLVPGAGVAQLQLGDRFELHNEIKIGGRSRRYLRLHWPAALKNIHPERFEMLENPEALRPVERRAVFSPGDIQNDGEYVTIHYDIPAALPARSFQLSFPDSNIMLRASLEYHADGGQDWRACSTAVFYRLSADGRTLINPRSDCSASLANGLRLRVKTKHWLNAGARAPDLVLWWAPHDLSFLLQGEEPFTLAWGSGVAKPNPESVTSLIGGIDQQNQSAMIGKAQVFEHVSLGGIEQLEIEPEPIAWQRMLLWLVLVGGVIALVLMAATTLREMQEMDEQSKSED